MIATVVVPARNCGDQIQRLLTALEDQTIRSELAVVVVDNGSSDDTALVAAERADMVVLEPTQGIGPARQRGLQEVQTEIVLMTDADCIPRDASWAQVLTDALTKGGLKRVGATGPVQPMSNGDRWSQRDDVTPQSGRDGEGAVLYPAGPHGAFWTEMLHKVGGYTTDPLIPEDMDIARRLRTLGSFAWVPDAVILHENPIGWRGYARQMRKVGRYAATATPPPHSWVAFDAFHAARLVKCSGRELLRGDTHEAAAQALKIGAMTLGANDVRKERRKVI